MKVLAIDPGVTTGYARGEIVNKTLSYKIFQFTDDVDDLWRRLSLEKPRYVIYETFEFRNVPQHARSGINLFPVQLIGVIRLYEVMAGVTTAIYGQTPATAKGYYSNKMLREKGLYKRGDEKNFTHGVDASRHLLHWCTFGAGHKFFEHAPADFIIRVL